MYYLILFSTITKTKLHPRSGFLHILYRNERSHPNLKSIKSTTTTNPPPEKNLVGDEEVPAALIRTRPLRPDLTMHLVSEPIQSPLTLELEISHTPSLDIDVLTTGELGNTSVKTIQEEYDADIRIIHQNVNEGMDMNEIDELLHHASVTRDGKLMTMEMTLMIAQERSKTMVSIYMCILNFFFNTLYYTLHYVFHIINTFFNVTFLMSGVSKRKSSE